MSDYAKLCEELTALPELVKSQPAPAAVEAAPEAAEAPAEEAAPEAAAEAEEAAGEAEEAPEAAAEEAPEAEEVVAKALRVTLPDGTEAEGFDASETIERLQGELAKALETVAEQGKLLSASASMVKSLHGVVASHTTDIDALRAEVAAFGKQGAGRKGVVMAKATPAPAAAKQEMAYPDLMTKALALQSEGKISGSDVNRIEAYKLRGLGVPEDLSRHFVAA